MASASGTLTEYRRKRDFHLTSEPSGSGVNGRRRRSPLRFVIQKHAASHLHFDLRLELDGVMKSWAVPKGPSVDPAVKRLAMEVEDHPIDYNTFEGTIPRGQYGGGTVMLWDRGTYRADESAGDDEATLRRQYASGRMSFSLHGTRLTGSFSLIRTRKTAGKPQWLLIKVRDEHARPGADVVAENVTSVDTGRTMDEIAGGHSRVWNSHRQSRGNPETASRKLRVGTGKAAATAKHHAHKSAVSGASLEPMYATTGQQIPTGPGWTYEPKYDGIRVLAFLADGSVRLITRNGNDKTRQFPEIVEALQALGNSADRPLVLDGEIVALTNGQPGRFQLLQSRMHVKEAAVVERHAEASPAGFIAFDILLDGDDVLVHDPWSSRRKRLERLLRRRKAKTTLLLSESIEDEGAALVERARHNGWEGVIAKRIDAPYQPGVRSRAWLKLKVEHRQEFVVGGYTEPRNTREHIGALLLGYFDNGRFIYAGHTGGGFTRAGLREMYERLEPLSRRTSPFEETPKTNERAHWTTPRVVVEVKFNEWTADGKLRQPIYLGTRDDKNPLDVRREPDSIAARTKSARKSEAVDSGARAPGTKKSGTRKSGTGGSGVDESVAPAPRARKRAVKEGPKGRPASGAVRRRSAADAPRRARATVKRPARKKPGPAKAASTSTRPVSRKSPPVPGKSASLPSSGTLSPSAATKVVEQLESIESRAGGDGTIVMSRGGILGVSSLGKVFFQKDGYTKGDLMRYYARVAPYLLPAIADRPLVLRRFPNGIDAQSFYQQNAPEEAPDVVRVETIRNEKDVEQRRLIGGDLATLLYTVQLGAISVDPWHGRVGNLEHADYTILDLDPGPRAPFTLVVEAARWVKEELDALGLNGIAKTSGSSGIHVFVPLPAKTPETAALLIAQVIATRIADAHPREATIERSVKARPAGAVYIDYLQNIRAKTVAAVYSARAKIGATVSTPLEWHELEPSLDPHTFTIETVPARIERLGDLWKTAMRKGNSLRGVIDGIGSSPKRTRTPRRNVLR